MRSRPARSSRGAYITPPQHGGDGWRDPCYLTVLAEGVETPAELSFLLSEGCDEVPGCLISRPLPAENLQDLRRQKGDDWLAGLDGLDVRAEARAQ